MVGGGGVGLGSAQQPLPVAFSQGLLGAALTVPHLPG